MGFLVRQFDPNLFKSFGKLEEEVPQLFKRLKYPFQISKSNLTAVGSPHTWPTILAALTWLIELLIYQTKAEEMQRVRAKNSPAAYRIQSTACLLVLVLQLGNGKYQLGSPSLIAHFLLVYARRRLATIVHAPTLIFSTT